MKRRFSVCVAIAVAGAGLAAASPLRAEQGATAGTKGLAQPGPRPAFGYNEDWHEHPNGFPLLSGLGAGVARQNLSWGRLETLLPGLYNWRPFDRVYGEMRAAGIRPLLVLLEAPCWAQPDPRACWDGEYNRLRPRPDHYDELGRFAAAAARRYPDAVGIQVWNEPNSKRFWGGKPNPEEYARMLREVAGAVQAANPDMPVVSAGLAPYSGRGGERKMAYRRFLERAYTAGGPQKADAIGIHPYPRASHRNGRLDSIRAQVGRVVEVMSRHGDEDKPIWITETGVSTTGPRAYTQERQARALVRIYGMLRRLPQIPVVIFHRFYDSPAGGKREAGFGLVRSDGARLKPAYCALAGALGGICPSSSS